MLGILTGGGLAAAAGLNAAIPLLLLGLAGRLVEQSLLPMPWLWLTDERVLCGIALLLVLELLSDAVPLLEQLNDWAQTVLRPAAGGIAFAAGVGVHHGGTDGATPTWLLVLVGVGIALAVHIGRLIAGEIARAADGAGAGAGGALTAMGNGGAIALAASALVTPSAVVAVGGAITVAAVLWATSRLRATAPHRTANAAPVDLPAVVSA